MIGVTVELGQCHQRKMFRMSFSKCVLQYAMETCQIWILHFVFIHSKSYKSLKRWENTGSLLLCSFDRNLINWQIIINRQVVYISKDLSSFFRRMVLNRLLWRLPQNTQTTRTNTPSEAKVGRQVALLCPAIHTNVGRCYLSVYTTIL